jgi:hypothetical protein
VEGEKVRVFVDLPGGYLAGDDFAEKTIGSHGGIVKVYGQERSYGGRWRGRHALKVES